jgi:hypothetical protein
MHKNPRHKRAGKQAASTQWSAVATKDPKPVEGKIQLAGTRLRVEVFDPHPFV